MRLDPGRTWMASTRLDAASTAGDGHKCVGQRRPCFGNAEQTARENGLERAEGIGAIGARASLADFASGAAAAEQGGQVVGQDLGGEVLL